MARSKPCAESQSDEKRPDDPGERVSAGPDNVDEAPRPKQLMSECRRTAGERQEKRTREERASLCRGRMPLRARSDVESGLGQGVISWELMR